MAINNVFLQILQGLKFNQTNKEAQIVALEALIRTTTPKGFRKAVLKHAAVFASTDQPQLFENRDNNEAFLAAAGEGEQSAANNIVALRQMAAQKRIEFGLEHPEIDITFLKQLAESEEEQGTLTLLADKASIFGEFARGLNALSNPKTLTLQGIAAIKATANKQIEVLLTTDVAKMHANIVAESRTISDLAQQFNQDHRHLQTVLIKLNGLKTLFSSTEERLTQAEIELSEDSEEKRAACKDLIDDLTDILQAQSKRFIDAQEALLDGEEEIDLNASSAVLKTAMERENKRFEAVKKAMELLSLCIESEAALQNIEEVDEEQDDEEEDLEEQAAVLLAEEEALKAEAQAKIDAIQKNLILLKLQYNCKLATENALLLARRIEAINEHTGSERELQGKLGLAEGAQRNIQKALGDTRAALASATTDAAKVDEAASGPLLQGIQEQLTAGEASLVSVRLWVNKSQGLTHQGDIFLGRDGVMADHFNTVVVNAGAAAPTQGGTADPTALHAQIVGPGGAQARYQRVKLNPGQQAYSTAVFTQPATPTVPNPPMVRAQLVQHADGSVTDKTTDRLTEEQSVIKALKHAELLLMAYIPKQGDSIIIRGAGAHKEQASRVFAALLLLKESNPALKEVKIVSEVPGCEVPSVAVASTLSFFVGGNGDQDTLNQQFINKWLPSSALVSEERKQQLKTQVAQFAEVKEGREATFKSILKQLRTGKADDGTTNLTPAEKTELGQRLERQAFQENEEITVDEARGPRI